jgi:ABC-type glycerol-3-phosphate transport system substrate-binding protein
VQTHRTIEIGKIIRNAAVFNFKNWVQSFSSRRGRMKGLLVKAKAFFIHPFLILLLFLSGCSDLPFLRASATPTSSLPKPTLTQEATATAEASQTPAGAPPGPVTLSIWLPPQFDPASGTPAGELLQARLDEFVKRRPGVRLEVRIKALEGPGGMLESLSTASAAAPQAIPDLIALPRPILEAAALKGLLHPYDGLTTTLDNTDWYNYARQLARLQNSTFGIPFAGDALILAYRPQVVTEPPRDWNAVLQAPGMLVFPAADPQALCTLAFYQAAGGEVQDDQGRPSLDAPTLARVFDFYQELARANILPASLNQIDADSVAWAAFQEGQPALALTWFSRVAGLEIGLPPTRTLSTPAVLLTPDAGGMAAAPIPTPDGVRYTLATGWVWALSSHYPERQALAVQLAEFLTQSSFLAEWTLAAGFLPPRSSALEAWAGSPAQALAGQIVISSHLYPSSDVLSSLAQPLREAVAGILQGTGDPVALAQEVVDRLANP